MTLYTHKDLARRFTWHAAFDWHAARHIALLTLAGVGTGAGMASIVLSAAMHWHL